MSLKISQLDQINFKTSIYPSLLPSKVKPTLKFTHLTMRQALCSWAKLHPGSLGVESSRDVIDGLYNQVSLSVRVLCHHFRRCAESTKVWATARRRFLAKDELEKVEGVLRMIKVEDDELAMVPVNVEESTENDWWALQASAPNVELWEVLGSPCESGILLQNLLINLGDLSNNLWMLLGKYHSPANYSQKFGGGYWEVSFYQQPYNHLGRLLGCVI